MTPAEFETFYIQHEKDFLGIAEYHTNDIDVAKDVVQDMIAMRLANGDIAKVVLTPSTRGYFLRAIRFYCRRYVWSNVKENHKVERNCVSFFDENEPLHTALWEDDHSSLEGVTDLERGIETVLRGLSPQDHDLVCCVIYARMPYKEIAKKLKCTEVTARKRYSTLLPRLRAALLNVGISARSCDGNRSPGTAGTAA